MNKTDKELTVEIVNAFINSWSGNPKFAPCTIESIPEIIRTVYDTISNLDKSEQ